MKVFIDLEETLVDPVNNGWANARLMDMNQLSNIKEILLKYKASSIDIFSFALATKFDQQAFNVFLKDRIELVLTVKINSVITHSEMMRKCGYEHSSEHGNHLSSLMKIGKRNAFLNFCKSLLVSDEFILIDDSVMDETVEVNGNKIHFINAIF